MEGLPFTQDLSSLPSLKSGTLHSQWNFFPFLTHFCSQPPLSFVSQGWTETQFIGIISYGGWHWYWPVRKSYLSPTCIRGNLSVQKSHSLLLLQVFSSSFSSNPSLQEHVNPVPALVHLCWQPALSFLSQGCSEMTMFIICSGTVSGSKIAVGHRTMSGKSFQCPTEFNSSSDCRTSVYTGQACFPLIAW